MILYPPGGHYTANGYFTIKPREDITATEWAMIDRLENGWFIVIKSIPEDELLAVGGPYPSADHLGDAWVVLTEHTDETVVTIDGNWYGPADEIEQEIAA